MATVKQQQQQKIEADTAHKVMQTSSGLQLLALEAGTSPAISALAKIIVSWMNHQGFIITNVGESIALCHSELSEALEAARKGNFNGQDGVEEELADTIIRILHLAAHIELDVAGAIFRKMHANLARPFKHGKEF